jgi:phosphatidylserine decarboxylase
VLSQRDDGLLSLPVLDSKRRTQLDGHRLQSDRLLGRNTEQRWALRSRDEGTRRLRKADRRTPGPQDTGQKDSIRNEPKREQPIS